MKHTVEEAQNPLGIDTDFRRPALVLLLLFAIAVLAWLTVAEFLFGIPALAFFELALGLYFGAILYFVRLRPYSKAMALSFLIPLLSLILVAMAHPETPPNVFIWVFLLPVLAYSLLGRQLGLVISSGATLLALFAFLYHYGNSREGIHPLIVTNVVICLAAIWVAMHLYERNRERTTIVLRRMATTDELTGLHNRRQLETVFARLASAADRQHHVLAVIVMDLDHFKQINDRWGHHAGDAVLVHVAKLLRERLRESDWAFRIGGEEFCLFLPMASPDGAAAAAEALRRQIAEHPCDAEGQRIPLSASIGLVLYPDNAGAFEQLLSLADARMYRAKQLGRNRVVGDDAQANPVKPGATPIGLQEQDVLS